MLHFEEKFSPWLLEAMKLLQISDTTKIGLCDSSANGRNSDSCVHGINLDNFGNLAGATVVDFGCGDGSFLQKCLMQGASYCVGIDLNETITKSGKDTKSEYVE